MSIERFPIAISALADWRRFRGEPKVGKTPITSVFKEVAKIDEAMPEHMIHHFLDIMKPRTTAPIEDTYAHAAEWCLEKCSEYAKRDGGTS
jgi:hypothetical protein